MEAFIYFLLLAGVVCAVWASNIAGGKGHSAGLWFLLGFLGGVLALIAAAMLNDANEPKASSVGTSANKGRRPCPECAELVMPAALKCRFCGAKLDPIVVTEDAAASETLEALPEGITMRRGFYWHDRRRFITLEDAVADQVARSRQ